MITTERCALDNQGNRSRKERSMKEPRSKGKESEKQIFFSELRSRQKSKEQQYFLNLFLCSASQNVFLGFLGLQQPEGSCCFLDCSIYFCFLLLLLLSTLLPEHYLSWGDSVNRIRLDPLQDQRPVLQHCTFIMTTCTLSKPGHLYLARE